ncbi:hypothetical protein EG329_008645 [Mollisiaceae sp. DMI_Dod_QoI]|nr:hypothetical protein EG329_008645 [Helotiales sp. DMI_Dod_QoI]
MTGRTIILHRAMDKSSRGRKPSRRKSTRNSAAPARRPIRHRHAKILPSIETDRAEIEDSESDMDDPDDNPIRSNARSLIASSHPGRATSIAEPSRVNADSDRSSRNRSADASEDDGSEYHPSGAEEEVGEVDDDHRQKRSRLGNAPSCSKTDDSKKISRRGERHDPGEGSSRSVDERDGSRMNMNFEARRLLKRMRTEGRTSSNRTNISNLGSRDNKTHDAREGPSRGQHGRASSSVQYLHTLTRTILRAAPPPGQSRQSGGTEMDLVDRRRMKEENQEESITSSRTETTNAVISRNETHDPEEGSSRAVRGPVNYPPQEIRSPSTSQQGEPSGSVVLNLVDCRNERNGLDGNPSNGKQPRVDPSQKCQPCFKFPRNCDQVKPSCGACTRTNLNCVPQKRQERPVAPEFSGSQLWEKCQSCAALKKQCTFDDDEEDCQNCKKRGWKCRAQGAPKPKTRQPNQGRNQDVSLKCQACVKARSHCDGAKPKYGHCAKWG